MKWEYSVLNIKEMYEMFSGNSYKAMLDANGLEGWELVSVDSGIAYFKRPIESDKMLIVNNCSKEEFEAIIQMNKSRVLEYIDELHQVGQLSDYSKDKLLSLL